LLSLQSGLCELVLLFDISEHEAVVLDRDFYAERDVPDVRHVRRPARRALV
jgi:hypothetical protein